jgi:hypothetical protein
MFTFTRRVALAATAAAATGSFALTAAPALAFNPQPDSPGVVRFLNPQPLPPGSLVFLNPQPLPPAAR